MGVLQMLLAAARADITALVHDTGEGGGEGSYDAAAGSCTVTFANTGVFSGSKATSTATSPYNWLTSGLPANAEIFFHQTSGTAVTGAALDTWLNCGTSRSLSLSWPGGAGSSTATIQVSIRDAISGNVKVSAESIVLNTHP